MQKILDFISFLYKEHFNLVLLVILFIAIILIIGIILQKINSKRKQEKIHSMNANAVKTLTDEEIDNISKNVANKEEFIKLVTEEPTEEKPEEQTASEETTATEEVEVSEENQTNVEQPLKEVNKQPKTEEKAKVQKPKTAQPKTTQPKKETKKVEPTEQKVEDNKKGYTGKWKIKQDGTKFYAELNASNGGMLLRTEPYTSLTGVKNGIATIKKNVTGGNFAISIDKTGRYRFKLFSSSNRLICVSEDYSSKAKCESGIESVKRFAETAQIIREETNNETSNN